MAKVISFSALLVISLFAFPNSATYAQTSSAGSDRDAVALIPLDLRMPGPTDGEDLLFLLRGRGDDVPIIVVSAWVDDEVLSDQPDCVHAVLKKPIQFSKLTSTVREALTG